MTVRTPARNNATLRRCIGLLSRTERRRWFLVAGLAVVVSVFEGVGALLVFGLLGMLTTAGSGMPLPAVGDLSELLPGMEPRELMLVAAGVVAVFFLVRLVLVTGQAYLRHRVTEELGAHLAIRLFGGYMAMPLSFSLRRNSAELVRNTFDTVKVVVREVFLPAATIFSEALIVLTLLAVLLWTAPLATALALAALGPLLWLLLRAVHPRLEALGATSQEMSRDTLGLLQQSLHGWRDIRLLGREQFFVDTFAARRLSLARSYYARDTTRHLSRTVLETALVLLIVGFSTVGLLVTGRDSGTLAVLGLFGYTAIRLKPSLSAIVGSLNSLRYATSAVEHVHDDLTLVEAGTPADLETAERLAFQGEIRLEDVGFRYDGAHRDALEGVNLHIDQGESIGIVGPTGGGKSTLVDVMIGLLEPTSGRLTVDGIDVRGREAAWQRNIGAVGQNVFLIDGSLRNNVALGVPDDEVDESRVLEALEFAQLDRFVTALPGGLDTQVGERGVRLSGGQRQRLALARALYRRPAVLVLDEGTSALDNGTEAQLMEELELLRGERTIIMVAHRLTTVRRCDRIVLVQGGRLTAVGSFGEVMANSSLADDTPDPVVPDTSQRSA